jgi:hypothetical protein
MNDYLDFPENFIVFMITWLWEAGYNVDIPSNHTETVGWALTTESKGAENVLHSKIDHDCRLCVDATEVCMILYK